MNPEDVMLKVPASIKRAELDLFDAKKRADQARFQLKILEAEYILDARKVLDAEGKPAYRNHPEREGAARRRLDTDLQAKAFRKEVAEEEAMASRIQAQLGYLQDLQRNARVLLLSRSPSTLVFEEATP